MHSRYRIFVASVCLLFKYHLLLISSCSRTVSRCHCQEAMRYNWYEWWSMRSFKRKAAQKLVLAVFVFVVAVALQTQTDLCPNRRLTWNYALVIFDTVWIFYCNTYLARFCVILWSYLLLAILVSLPWYSTHSTYSETNCVKILKIFVLRRPFRSIHLSWGRNNKKTNRENI